MVYIIATLLRKAFEQKRSGWQELMLVPDDYDDAALIHPLTRQLMEQIEFRHGGPEYDAKYPDGIPTTLEIDHAELGTQSSGLVMYPQGHARNPSTELETMCSTTSFASLAAFAVDDPNGFARAIRTIWTTNRALKSPLCSTFRSVACESMNSSRFGFLNFNKPPGKTSRWVVDQVQRLVQPAKVGHAGTLDPLATGVLVVASGSATRLIDYVQQMPKRYRADFLLGCTSPTEDVDSEVVPLENPMVPTRDEIETAIPAFLGEILQSPPAFSALKVGGRRAYSLARAGQAVELKPRPISIHCLKVLSYEYPRLQLEIECSSGTYVRSLGRDLAEKLGTGAVMSALVRTAIGIFRVEDSIDVFDGESVEPGRLSIAGAACRRSLAGDCFEHR